MYYMNIILLFTFPSEEALTLCYTTMSNTQKPPGCNNMSFFTHLSQIIIMMEWSNRRCYQNFTKGRSQLLGCLAYTAVPIAEVFHELA